MASSVIKKPNIFNAPVLNNVDLNTITDAGLYYVDGGSNIPAGSNGFLLVMSATNITRVKQFFFRYGTLLTNSMQWFGRDIRIDGSTIGPWYQITNTQVS